MTISTSLKAKKEQASSPATLIPGLWQRLIELGAPLLLTETEGRLALAERKIKTFEQQYGITLAQLCKDGLPDDASIEMHEDFIEWSGWQRTREEASQMIVSLQHLSERSLAPASTG